MAVGLATVTGSSRGIGQAIAPRLAEAGNDVAVDYLERADEAAAVAERIALLGVRAQADPQGPIGRMRRRLARQATSPSKDPSHPVEERRTL